MSTAYDILVVGGGAAGFFTAINAADSNPELRIGILERSNEVLSKVRVSGGGRCNVTHAAFDPSELVQNYPRGNKELLGPFHRFSAGDTMAWFEKRGIDLKIEEDGRVFPQSDSSQTIIDCLLQEAKRLGIDILLKHGINNVFRDSDSWILETNNCRFRAASVVLATGSSKRIWEMLGAMGHTIVPPVPSLFTFNLEDPRITELPGISTKAVVELLDHEDREVFVADGSLHITHWGLSGPVILRLSAWAARWLAARNYKFSIRVNWIDGTHAESAASSLDEARVEHARKMVVNHPVFGLPKRLWKGLLEASEVHPQTTWSDLKKKEIGLIVRTLTGSLYHIKGKSTFKEEFVTAGGVELKEVDFKTFESKLHRGLYFAGEILDIDAITGGFNFQNAWTGGYLAALALSKLK